MRALRDVAPYLDLGWRIAFAVVLTVGGGVALDQWLGTLPAFTIGGMLLGLASAFVQIARLNRPPDVPEEGKGRGGSSAAEGGNPEGNAP